MTKEKSITGGEVDMTELKQKMIDFVFDYEGKSLACDIVDYLASKGHLKTTVEDEWQPFSKELLDKALSEPGQWEIRIAAAPKEKE